MLCDHCQKPFGDKEVTFFISLRKFYSKGYNFNKEVSPSLTMNYHGTCFQEFAGEDFIKDICDRKEAGKLKTSKPPSKWWYGVRAR